MEYTQIARRVQGLWIQNERFSTTHISVNLYLPLEKETLAANALLPFVLSSCCAAYPAFSDLHLRLAQLYGADVGGMADKIGDMQILRFFSYCINDDLAPDGTRVVEQACDLLFSMLFEPSVQGDSFLSADVERERRLTLEKIAGIVHDKRGYAVYRTLSTMYEGEAFGELKTGSAEAVSRITECDLYAAYRRVMSRAMVRVQVVGKEVPNRLFERLAERFSAFSGDPYTRLVAKPKELPVCVRRVDEPMDVTQGKLVLGLVSSEIEPESQSVYRSVFADLLGGGPYSKLFTNVREKMSLCYYCSARVNRNKGYLLIDCGVEPENAKQAETEILNQLEDLKQGRFTKEELDASIRSIRDTFLGLNDRQSALDSWYAMSLAEQPLSPEDFITAVEAVTPEDIMCAAASYHLDTVYRILPNHTSKGGSR